VAGERLTLAKTVLFRNVAVHPPVAAPGHFDEKERLRAGVFFRADVARFIHFAFGKLKFMAGAPLGRDFHAVFARRHASKIVRAILGRL
jgi:hypothetical protein